MLTQPEGMTLFAALPQSDGREQGIVGLPDGSRLWRETRNGECFWHVEQEGSARLQFRGKCGRLAIYRLADRNGNGWQFDWQGRDLERIREFSTCGMSGREILVTGRIAACGRYACATRWMTRSRR